MLRTSPVTKLPLPASKPRRARSGRLSPDMSWKILDAQFILDHTEGIVGFYGASSIERLPVEPAIRDRVREFTEMTFKGK